MELTYEQSAEAAKPIKQMAEIARTLNVEYLTECLEKMKENHSFRQSAMVLNPSPFTANQQSDLEASKIKGLELMLELAKNQNDIFEKEIDLLKAKQNIQQLGRLFGD